MISFLYYSNRMCYIIQLWNDALTKLKVDVTQHEVILTESELNVGKDRATMAQIIFEKYGAPGLYIGNESALSLFSHQQRTGVVVDCGHNVCTIVMIYRGQRCQMTNTILNYGGRDVTMRLLSDLFESGYEELNYRDLDHVDEVKKIKEKVAYVSGHYYSEMLGVPNMDSISVPCQVVKDQVRNANIV